MGQISSAPVELIRVQRGGGADWRGAVAEMQGWRADHEDSHFMRDGGGEGAGGYSVFGVLDGHGGCEAARLAAHDRLPALLRDACLAADRGTRDLAEVVTAAFVETDAWLRTRPEVARDQSGTTCVVAGLKKLPGGGYGAFIGNAGDSRGAPRAARPRTSSRRTTTSRTGPTSSRASRPRAASCRTRTPRGPGSRPPSSRGSTGTWP